MMEENGGTLLTKMQPNLEDSSGLDIVYMALLGIKAKDNNVIDACPLSWSHQSTPTDSRMVELLQRCGGAFKNVFGLSDMELYGEIRGRPLVGAPKQYEKLKSGVVRKELARLESGQLEALVKDIQSLDAARHGRVKKNFNIFQADEEIALNIVGKIPVEETDGIMLITVNEAEQVMGFSIESQIELSSKRSERDAFCKYLFQLLFRVILLRTGEKTCRDCPELVKHFQHYAVLKKRHDTAQDFLKDESLKRETADPPPKVSVCEECGESFDISTDHKRYLYQKHKREHSYMNFKCDCPVTWTALIDKERHINLVHKKGYKKCDHCTFVGKPATVAQHIQDRHVEVTCEHCGLVIKNRNYLPVHIARHHPQKADEKNLTKLVGGKCKYCGENFKRLREHIKRAHINAAKAATVVCPDCGKTFKKCNLKNHVLNVHTPVDQLEFSCQQCPRRYVKNFGMNIMYFALTNPQTFFQV